MDEKTKRLIQLIKVAKSSYSEDNFVLVIPKFMSKAFVSFCSIREDLLLIKEFIERHEVEKHEILLSSLTYSIVSLYGKCFTDATITKSSKLEANQLFEENTELLSTHDYLMNLRHHFVAHRGETLSEVSIAYLLIPKGKGLPHVRFAQLKQMKFSDVETKNIKTLIDFILEILIKKIQKSGEKTYKGYLDNFTAEEMQFMTLNNMKEEKEE